MFGIVVTLSIQFVLTCATAVEAQQAQPQRPNRGLFGQRKQTRQPPHWTDLTMSVSSGYDENAIDDTETDSSTLLFDRTGLYSNVQTALRHTRARRDRRLTISAGDTARYYTTSQVFMSNLDGGVSFASPLWRGGRVELNQRAAYTPYYQLQIFPEFPVDVSQAPTAPSSDYALGKRSASTYSTFAAFTHGFGASSALTLTYDRRSVMFSAASGRDLLTQGGNVRFTRRLTRSVGFHAGIGSRVARYEGPEGAALTRTRDLDIGLDYNRPLKFSRRTTVNFSTGSSLMPQNGRTQYHVTGNAALTHEIGRTWTANLQYNRAVQFVEAFPEPFLSDSIAARIQGSPSRRVSLVFSGGYTAGAIGESSSAGGRTLGTYTATGELGVAVSRHVALYADYLHYRYRLDQPTTTTFLPHRLDRRTARVGLKLWFPVFD